MKSYSLIPILFFYCLIFSTNIKGSNWTTIQKDFDTKVDSIETYLKIFSDCSECPIDISDFYAIAADYNIRQLWARAYYWDAQQNINIDIRKSDRLINLALSLNDSIKYPYDHARFLFLKGIIFSKYNRFSDAYKTFKHLDPIFSKQKDLLFMGNTAYEIASMFKKINEHQEARDFFLDAANHYKMGGYKTKELMTESQIAMISYHLGNTNQAKETLISILKNPIISKDSVFLANTLSSLYFISENLKDKIGYAKKAYKLSKNLENTTAKTYAIINLGACYIYLNKNDSALYYYKKSKEIAESHNDTYSLIHSLYGLSEIYYRLGMNDSAYISLKSFYKIKESSGNFAKSIQMNREELRKTIEEYKEILTSQKEHILYQKKITCVVIIAAIFIILSLVYNYHILRKKTRLAHQLKDSENKELFERLEKEKIRSEKLSLEIDMKNRELTTNSMILLEKEQLFKDIIKQINDADEGKAFHKEEKNELIEQIKGHLIKEDEWLFFKRHFEEVHPHFFNRLQEQYPSLSENDKKLCAYIKTGMSNKQIAKMLSVQPDSVNTSRYRIRKKMQLSQSDSLENVLRKL